MIQENYDNESYLNLIKLLILYTSIKSNPYIEYNELLICEISIDFAIQELENLINCYRYKQQFDNCINLNIIKWNDAIIYSRNLIKLN